MIAHEPDAVREVMLACHLYVCPVLNILLNLCATPMSPSHWLVTSVSFLPLVPRVVPFRGPESGFCLLGVVHLFVCILR